MWNFIKEYWLPELLTIIIISLVSRILYKSPSLRSFFKPSELEESVIRDRDEWKQRCATLEKENTRLTNGNEFLLDELAIARTVRDGQRDKLDLAYAEFERVNATLTGIQRQLGHDV